MKFCRVVQKKDIMNTAMSMIRSVRTEVVATMNLKEELVSPLPKQYHALIANAAKKGIVVKRFGFGSKVVFQKFVLKYTEIQFLYAGGVRNYQRMLIVDQTRAMFSLGGLIFLTDFSPLIVSLVKYVEIIYNKEVL